MSGLVALVVIALAALAGYVVTYLAIVRPQAARADSLQADWLATLVEAQEHENAALVDLERIADTLGAGVDHSVEWSEEQRRALFLSLCGDCGCIHTIACPRIKRSRFGDNGTTRVEVEYFASWPHDGVVSVDDYMEQNEPPTSVGVRVTG